MRQGLGLHLQVHFGVDVGGIQRDVAQPGADRIDVHAGPEQVDGGGVPKGVCAHVLRLQRLHAAGGLARATLNERMDTETGQGFSPAIEEHRIVGCSTDDDSVQSRRGLRPEGAVPNLAPFAGQPDRGGTTPDEVGDRQPGRFVNARAGVVEE